MSPSNKIYEKQSSFNELFKPYLIKKKMLSLGP